MTTILVEVSDEGGDFMATLVGQDGLYIETTSKTTPGDAVNELWLEFLKEMSK